MGAFDPDAYLAKPAAAAGGFDPDAYLVKRLGLTGAAAIPGGEKPMAVEKEREASLQEKLLAPVETGVGMLTNLISSPVVAASKIYGTLTSGKYGTQAGIQAGEETGRKVQEFFAPALSPTAQKQTQAIANALASTGLEGVPMNVLSDLGRAVPAATRAITDAGRVPVAARAARIQEANVAKSYANAPIIDAAQAADRVGLVVNPAITNPNVANRLKGAVVGPEFDAVAAKENAARTTQAVRKDLGIAPTQKLDQTAIETALDKASAGYDPIRKMSALEVPNDSVKALESLRKEAPIGGDTKTAAINSLVDETLKKLQKTTSGPFTGVGGGEVHVGRSGSMILEDIRSMRRDAQAIYKAQQVNPDPLAIAKADTQMAISKILEGVIDANAPSPKILSDMQKARVRMAQIYDHDLAIDYANHTVDPQVYAKLLNDRKGNMTGVGADIGKVAATFPDLMTTQAPAAQIMPTVKRSGLGAAAGALIGGAVGNYPGAIAGATAGATAGSLGTRVLARNMLSPEYQSSRAIPTDYRSAANNLKPADINYGPNQITPYQAPVEVLMPGQQPYQPNFTQPAQPTFGVGPMPYAQRALPNEVPKQIYQAQKNAELAQEYRAAAERKPARGGSIIDIDPVTGKMTLGAEGTAGMTPNTQVIESTGKALQSAAEKVAANKLFDMTAAEKVAWTKTRADLAEVSPGLAKLSDKDILARMSDRKLAQDTLDKARQKAQMFDEIAKRAESAQAKHDAAVKRDQMLDLLQTLEDNLRAPRPTSGGGQGPKTRNFLAEQNKNALRGQ